MRIPTANLTNSRPFLSSLAILGLFSFALASICVGVSGSLAVQSSASNSKVASPCHVEGKLEIALDCDYQKASAPPLNKNFEPRIILNHSKLWFRVKDDSRMRVELTFTNASGQPISEARTVYIAIDDESGQNHLRRQLPSVDFTKLVPGKPTSFSEILRAPAFQPSNYTIYLWIPSSDPALKFDTAHNFQLSNEGVPDEKSGLNAIATFSVVR